jgi:hypothetical protein
MKNLRKWLMAGLTGLVLASGCSKQVEKIIIDGEIVILETFKGDGIFTDDWQRMKIGDSITIFDGCSGYVGDGIGDPNSKVTIRGYTFGISDWGKYYLKYPNGGIDRSPAVNEIARQKLQLGAKLMGEYQHKIELQKFGDPKVFAESLESEMSHK